MRQGSLPLWFEKAIESLLEGIPLADLQRSYETLSHRYHSPSLTSGLRSSLEAVAYAIARLPATYAVVKRCLTELPQGYAPASILDIGAGPGTASLACLDFYDPAVIDLYEQSPDMIRLGQKLLASAPSPVQSTYIPCDLSQKFPENPDNAYDLVLASYVFGELSPSQHQQLLRQAYAVAKDYLIIILPGTPKGFEVVRSLRECSLKLGAHILAPCTHAQRCPMGPGDWCHFSERLPRSPWHKKLKKGDLGYEDEKFSYLILSKSPSNNSDRGRVVKNPRHKGGHGTLEICRDGKLSQISYSRKKSLNYKELKSLRWGDLYT
jgi:ribosomal protein RSM22 (predicted rRNA methylase)